MNSNAIWKERVCNFNMQVVKTSIKKRREVCTCDGWCKSEGVKWPLVDEHLYRPTVGGHSSQIMPLSLIDNTKITTSNGIITACNSLYCLINHNQTCRMNHQLRVLWICVELIRAIIKNMKINGLFMERDHYKWELKWYQSFMYLQVK